MMPLTEIWARIKVLAGAVPAWGAALTAVLSSFSTSVVPLLPVAWQVKAAAVVAAVVAGIATVVKVVARVTQVPPEAVGLILPEGQQMRVELVGAPWPAGHVHPGAEPVLRVGNVVGHIGDDEVAAELRRMIRVGDPTIVEELRRIVRADGGDVRRALG
jgi:hypothetical protein